MKLTYFKFLQVIFLIILGCTEKKNRDLNEDADADLYPDGAYCADVTYYNRDTDKTIEYKLNVEIENGKLTKIHWANGGWTEEPLIIPVLVDSKGFCVVQSKGGSYQYSISITGAKCLVTDSLQYFGPYEGIITRAQCAANFGASDELFNAYLNHNNLTDKFPITRDDLLTFQDCELFQEKLTTYIRTREPSNIDKGFIQKVFTSTNGLGIICQTMVVQQNGVNYLLEIEGGNSTMGQTVYDPNSEKWLMTSFDPNIDGWHEIIVQENPEVDSWTVEVARVLLSGSMTELEHYANYFCR